MRHIKKWNQIFSNDIVVIAHFPPTPPPSRHNKHFEKFDTMNSTNRSAKSTRINFSKQTYILFLLLFLYLSHIVKRKHCGMEGAKWPFASQ